MIAMTKFEMVRYLKDYADLQYEMMKNPDKQIKYLFTRLMYSKGRPEDNTREYYDRMRRVYINYTFMKNFSYTEDFLLNRDNFINNDELDEIIPENTYSTDMNGISKKNLLQLIRNSFNHNDSEQVDKFKMSLNGRKIEIELLNGPIKIKFDADKLWYAYHNMIDHRRNNLNVSFDIPDDFNINSENLFEELDKIKYVRYYFDKQIPKEMVEKFAQINDTRGLSEEEIQKRSEMFHTLSSSINEPVKFDLTVEQKKKLESDIQLYKKQNPYFLEQDINYIMFYFLKKVIPVPLMKKNIIDNQIIYCARFMEDVYESLDNIIKEVRIILNEKNPFNPNDSFDQETFEYLNKRKPIDNLNLFRDLLDGEMTAAIPVITYIDSVIMHCCKEESININGIDYNVKKIRNSFAHGRWFITADKCIIMYDANPKNNQDYNLNFVGKIHIGAFEEWADAYIEQNMKSLDVVRGKL